MRAHRLRTVAGDVCGIDLSICTKRAANPDAFDRKLSVLRGPTSVEPVATRQRAVSARSLYCSNRLSEAASAPVSPLPGRQAFAGWSGLKSNVLTGCAPASDIIVLRH